MSRRKNIDDSNDEATAQFTLDQMDGQIQEKANSLELFFPQKLRLMEYAKEIKVNPGSVDYYL